MVVGYCNKMTGHIEWENAEKTTVGKWSEPNASAG